MDRDLKRYFKQQQHGGRNTAARLLDGITLRLLFVAACYLWFRYNIENKTAVILLTAITTLLFLAAAQLWREITFERFIKREQARLSDLVLRERLLLMQAGAFASLCDRVAAEMPGLEDAYLWCTQRAAPLTQDDIIAAYRGAQREGALRLAIFSLSPPDAQAAAFIERLPIHADALKPELLLHAARRMEEYTVSEADIQAHIHSGQVARRELRARVQAEPFAAGRAKKYLLCAALLTAVSFITGYALYYRLLAGLCLMLGITSFVLNRPSALRMQGQ